MRTLSLLVLSLLLVAPVAQAGGGTVDAADRAAIADYYRSEHRTGHCPDGLTRTELGCERKPVWTLGAPLDPSIAVEPLPANLLAQLTPPRGGTAYVRAGDRILLMATVSRVILGELLDLGQIGPGQVAPRLRLSGGSAASR